jgi:dephospho-CoA kinase
MAEHILIGLTGMIGAGKSTVAERLKARGASIIDADLLARTAVRPGSEGLAQISAHFGPAFLTPAGELDRKKLGQAIFNDDKKRKELEQILHPQIRKLHAEALQRILNDHKADTTPHLIVAVIPLLFEAGQSYEHLKYKVLVAAPRTVCIDRIIARDQCTRAEAEARYDSQMPEAKKRALSDFVIENSGSPAALDKEIERLLGFIK